VRSYAQVVRKSARRPRLSAAASSFTPGAGRKAVAAMEAREQQARRAQRAALDADPTVALCTFFAQGRCRRGQACTFRHRQPDGATLAAVQKSVELGLLEAQQRRRAAARAAAAAAEQARKDGAVAEWQQHVAAFQAFTQRGGDTALRPGQKAPLFVPTAAATATATATGTATATATAAAAPAREVGAGASSAAAAAAAADGAASSFEASQGGLMSARWAAAHRVGVKDDAGVVGGAGGVSDGAAGGGAASPPHATSGTRGGSSGWSGGRVSEGDDARVASSASAAGFSGGRAAAAAAATAGAAWLKPGVGATEQGETGRVGSPSAKCPLLVSHCGIHARVEAGVGCIVTSANRDVHPLSSLFA